MRISTFILLGGLLAHEANAAETLPTTLEKLFEHVNGLPNAKGVPTILERIKAQHPEELNALCNQIKETDFFDKAKAAGVGMLKSTAISVYCQSGTVYERADLKKATQKEKPAVAQQQAVKLKPVEFSKKSEVVEDEQKALKAVEQELLANAELLGKRQEFEIKLKKVTTQLQQAKESYDNLSVTIAVMREDLKTISNFKHFKPHDHDHVTPEKYLEALESSLPKESPHILDVNSMQQVRMASELLKQANENHALARLELEAINRELMQLTK